MVSSGIGEWAENFLGVDASVRSVVSVLLRCGVMSCVRSHMGGYNRPASASQCL